MRRDITKVRIKESSQKLHVLMRQESDKYLYQRLHFQDETRLGLITKCGRKLTAKGVKPIGIKASDYRNYYIYGTVEPESGGFLMYEFDKINSENFQEFLNAFELAYPEGQHVIVVDGSRTHFAKKLVNTPAY